MLSSMVNSYVSYINYIGIIMKIPGNTDLHLNLPTLRGRLGKNGFDITGDYKKKVTRISTEDKKTQKGCTTVYGGY